MHTLKTLLVLACSLILLGCSSTSLVHQAELATAKALAEPQIKYVVVKPDQGILEDCEVSRTPPPKSRYLAMTDMEREIAMAAYARSLQADLAKCALKPAASREFFEKAEKLYGGQK